MPNSAPRPCTAPGCTALAANGSRCPAHPYKRREIQRTEQGKANRKHYGNARWRKARATYLSRHPLCVECERFGRVTEATVVDHIIPHKGDMSLFWDTSNWQALCARHHNRKTAREDGGFGREPTPRNNESG